MLTRIHAMGYVAAACALVIVMLPASANAQTTQDRLDSTRKELDNTAARWFAAQNKVQSVDDLVARRTRDISATEARVASLRHVAVSRARLMYEGASGDYMTVIGDSAMDSARRAQLIENANARDIATIDDLSASLEDLRTQKEQLQKEEARQKDALDEVASERRTLDAQLTSLRQQAERDATVAARNAQIRTQLARAVQSNDGAATAPPTAPVSTGSGSGSQTLPVTTPPPSSGGTSPHHNDPFLVCTRARESNGNYGVVSADGQYYGAYQFLPSTWDITASHAGRNDLVGVSPSQASAYDQDEMAWTLYQWQGKGPWGGRC